VRPNVKLALFVFVAFTAAGTYFYSQRPITTVKKIVGTVCQIEGRYLRLETSFSENPELNQICNLSRFDKQIHNAKLRNMPIIVEFEETYYPVSGAISQAINQVRDLYPEKK
jgi:hypothetical protein